MLRYLVPFRPTIGIIALLIVAASLPSLFRSIHMIENGYAPKVVDLRGVAADFGVGVAFGLLLVLARKASAAAFVALAIFWLAANAGYYEFLRVFGSPFALVQAQYLGDPQFLEGSGLGVSHPLLLTALAIGLLSGLLIGRKDTASVATGAAIGWAIFLAVIPHQLPPSKQMSEWRQSDLVSINLGDVATRLLGGVAVADDIAHPPPMPDGLRADLTGERWLKASGKTNVLIVFVESISGGHIPAIAETAGMRSTIEMPRLSALTKSGLVFRRFVTQQNQSNRGVYAALCGDLPELAKITAKMSRIANGLPQRCLPRALGDAGYSSVFIKSAQSDFMQMREFGLKVGFDRVYGEEGASPDLPRGPWGLADDGLYATALQEVEQLDRGGKPWLMTLFTSGTHHPFKLRPGAVADGDTDRAKAWDFADRTLVQFVDDLKARGVLKNTLVILTSDEAGFVNDPDGRKEDYLYSLPENWGYVIALAPTGQPAAIDDYYAQSDLALSILDYLGLADGEKQFAGRSMFRRYTSPRDIVFGAVYHRRAYLFDTGSGDLTLCDERLTDCRLYRDDGHDLFSPNMHFVAQLPNEPAKLRAYQDYSLTLPRHRDTESVPPPDPLAPS